MKRTALFSGAVFGRPETAGPLVQRTRYLSTIQVLALEQLRSVPEGAVLDVISEVFLSGLFGSKRLLRCLFSYN